jgi:hypothetical protein
MPDWRAYVRHHLGSLGPARADDENVASELVAHLEEYYAALLAQGVPDEEACSRTCEQAGNWEELRDGIDSAKQEGMMNDRVRRIWVPGLVTLLSSYIALALLQRAGARPMFLHPGEPRGVVFFLPWLFLLLFIGAVGGYLSRRAKGNVWRAYLAASFPAVALGAFLLLLFPLAFVLDRQVPLQTQATSFAAVMFSWVVLPAIALCVGVALQGLHRRQWASLPR